MILERIDQVFSRVLKSWADDTAVLIGGGSSLTLRQVDLVKEARRTMPVRCIAVNDAYLIAPWADVLYAADQKWYRWHSMGIDKPVLGMTAAQVRQAFAAFAGERCSIQSARDVVQTNVHLLRNVDYPRHGEGLSLYPTGLVTGRNSGFQALNLSILAGAKTIILLGYDGRPSSGTGMANWHGEHPIGAHPSSWEFIRRSFYVAAPRIESLGVRVLNCSPGSMIGFESMHLRDALNMVVA